MSVRSWAVIAVLSALAAPVTSLAQSTARADAAVIPPGCPGTILDRTPLQVWNDHLAALQSGDPARIACDYAKDATVVMPGVVIAGRENVVNGFFGFMQQLGTLPAVVSVTPAGEVVMVEWTLDALHLAIADGSDTLVIEHGQIRYQTVHATFQFH